jgi:endonuclease/exonuclease/phosphatase family metal-dependent hydrolase
VGQEESARAIIGKHSLHKESNETGRKLINYATSLNMIAGSIIFPHRNIHKMPWRLLEENSMNQIDHMLTDSRHCNNLLDVRSYRGANTDSDHYLIIAKI